VGEEFGGEGRGRREERSGKREKRREKEESGVVVGRVGQTNRQQGRYCCVRACVRGVVCVGYITFRPPRNCGPSSTLQH